jgi:hypothetical protein
MQRVLAALAAIKTNNSLTPKPLRSSDQFKLWPTSGFGRVSALPGIKRAGYGSPTWQATNVLLAHAVAKVR